MAKDLRAFFSYTQEHAHAHKHRHTWRHVCSCSGTLCFQRNSRRDGGEKNEGRLRLGCGVCRSGDHMSHFAPCVVSDGLGFMLNNHVEVENKPYENPEERVAVRTEARLKRPHVSLNNSSVITPTVHINTHEHRDKHTAKRT